MSADAGLWLTFVLIGLATTLPRASFIVLGGRVRLPSVVQRALRYAPAAALAAIVTPDVLVVSGDFAPLNPKLAGQHPEYITKQLNNFKSGERANPVMGAMAASLSADDMVKLGVYFGAQKPKGSNAKENGPGSLGEKIYKGGVTAKGLPACASCHGPTGAGIPVQFPRLAGQHADYTVIQLKAFRSGERANAPMMKVIAGKMSDQDIAAVADYIQGLH